MLTCGNTKLGKGIWTWSIPAGSTCPGKTKLCQQVCYATKGHMAMASVTDKYARNLALWENEPAFIEWMTTELHRNAVRVLRLHVSGDFHKVEYIRAWDRILKQSPKVTAFAYTRSWRVKRLQQDLRQLAQRPNLYLWLSSDRESGEPPRWPHTRVAYMAMDDNDTAAFPVDLTFRVTQPTARNHADDGSLICRYETGGWMEKKTCSSCTLCFQPKPIPRRTEVCV